MPSDRAQPGGGRMVCIAEAIHVTALGLWGGALIASGAMAAIIFPMLRDADVQLPGFARYDGDHWPIAAGQVMNKVFAMTDWFGAAALGLAALTFFLIVLKRTTRHIGAATAVRAIVLGMLMTVVIISMAWLRPGMQMALHAYWQAAQAGDAIDAAQHHQAFEALHPRATFIMIMQLGLIVVALVAGIMCATMQPRTAEPK